MPRTVPGEGSNGTDYSPVGKPSQRIKLLVPECGTRAFFHATGAMGLASNLIGVTPMGGVSPTFGIIEQL